MSRWSRGAPAVGQRVVGLPGPGERPDRAELADQDPADEPVTADDDLAVRAAGGVGELHDVVTGQRLGLAERREVERPGLVRQGQPGEGAGARVGAPPPGQQVLGEGVGLFDGRGREPVDAARVLGAVPDRADTGVRRAQLVVDDDPLAHVEPGRRRETGPGAHPAREDRQISAEDIAVGELDAADRPVGDAHAPYPALRVHLHAERGEVLVHQV